VPSATPELHSEVAPYLELRGKYGLSGVLFGRQQRSPHEGGPVQHIPVAVPDVVAVVNRKSHSMGYCRSCDWPLRVELDRLTANWVVCTKTSLARRARMSRTMSGARPSID